VPTPANLAKYGVDHGSLHAGSPYDGAVAVISKLLRAGEGRIVRHLSAIADQIENLEGDFVDLTDEELRAQTEEFRARLEDGETLDHLLPEAYAVVREAARRTLGQFHYKVQLMGGAALHLGNIAEM
jgi:preprotein translocase subunit SecA